MMQRNLRASITIHLVLLLFAAMMLIDFVMISTLQKTILQREREKAIFFMSIFQSAIWADPAEMTPGIKKLATIARRLSFRADVPCILLIDRFGSSVEISQADCPLVSMKPVALESIRKAEVIQQVEGITWGVFWRQPRYLVSASPILDGNRPFAAVCTVRDLEDEFAMLRKFQMVLLLYIFANTIVLTLIGFYRFSSSIVRPMQKLVKRAEAYSEEDDFFFLQEQGENEYARLSRSLNRMLTRISQDKKDLKNAVQRLETANLDLQNAQESVIRAEKLASVGRLTSGIAHEIGNPVGIVTGYLDLLGQAGLSHEERQTYLSKAQEEVERIRKIIRELLDFSRPDGNVISEFECHEVIRSTMDTLGSQPLFTGIDIRLPLDAEFCRLTGDPDRFRQVMLNLVLNASDAVRSLYPETGGCITVQTGDAVHKDGAENWIEVAVSDNGSGISESDLANIFDPFFTTKEAGKGTGLGLAVSYMIIERMGGRMDVESDTGVGTTIRLQLPLCKKVGTNSG